MTQVIINKRSSNAVGITQAEVGKWYEVQEYEFNHTFEGEIGILIAIERYCTETDTWESIKTLVTADGRQLSHPAINLKLIDNISITAE